MRFLKRLSFLWPIILLLGLEFLLFKVNVLPGTWLAGWDSTQPELNFRAHLIRDLGAVWQEYRGLGLLDGMAHAANLVHIVYIFLLSYLFSPNVVRFVFIFLMHALGGVGVYLLISYLLGERHKFGNVVAGLAGGLFYLLSPVAIQMFYVPLELFIIHFGFLPWLLYGLIKYLDSGSRGSLVGLFIVNLLAVSQSHVPTIFIVYALSAFVFLVSYIKRKGKFAKRAKVALVVIVLVNAFWGLPYIYSAFKNAAVITNAKINQLSNPEVVLRNRAYGDFKNVALMRGFSLDYEDWQGGQVFDYQMPTWREHWLVTDMETVGWVLFGLALIGAAVALEEKNRKFIPFVILFAISLIALGTEIPGISLIEKGLRAFVPYYEEAFRFAFTKFAILFSFSYAVLVAYAVSKFLSSRSKLRIIGYPLALAVIMAIYWQALPAFKGNLIYHKLKLEMPSEYLEVFKFFDGKSNSGRVAILPQPSFWNWDFLDWGYRGSGFVWQGIANPTLHRSFDPWSAYNESYYHELSYAIYSMDSGALSRVLKKYGISYVLFDDNIIAPGQDKNILKKTEIGEMLEEIGASLVWESGHLRVYDLKEVLGYDNFVFAPSEYSYASSNPLYSREDVVGKELGDYITGTGVDSNNVIFPFASLVKEELDGISFQDGESGNIEFIRGVGSLNEGYQLVIPGIEEGTKYPVFGNVSYQGKIFHIKFDRPHQLALGEQEINLPELINLAIETDKVYDKLLVSLGENIVQVEQGTEVSEGFTFVVGEPIGLSVFDAEKYTMFDLGEEFLAQNMKVCWEREKGVGTLEAENVDDGLTVLTKDAAGCLPFRLGELKSAKNILVVSLPYRSKEGSRPHFCVTEEGSSAGCLHDDIFYNSSSSAEWSEVERQLILDGGKVYWLDVAARPPDTAGDKWQIEYKLPEVKSFPLIAQAVFGEGIWSELVKESRFEVGANNGWLKLASHGRKTNVSFAKSGGFEIDNCDLFDRGEVEKQVPGARFEFEGDVRQLDRVIYQSLNKGAACDFVSLNNVSTTQNHLLRFVGENVSGRSLKFYLFNKVSKRNDLEVLLKGGSFDQSFSLLSWPRLEEGGYVVNIETRSFGRETSENKIDEVAIYDLPLDWFATWRLEPSGGVVRTENNLEVTNISKTGTSLYSLTSNSKKDNGLLVLSQGYEDGWVAYRKTAFLSFIFSKRLSHVKVNTWANGWLVPEGEHDIAIVYWPQYLLYLGMVIGLVGFVMISFDIISRYERG